MIGLSRGRNRELSANREHPTYEQQQATRSSAAGGNTSAHPARRTRIGGIIMIGLRELVILAVVVLVLYGRTGVLKSRRFQTIWPWLSPQRRMPRAAGAVRALAAARPQAMPAPGAQRAGPAIRKAKPFLLQGNRLYWFLTILAATAVASVIIGRIMIASGVGPGLTH